MKKQKIIKIKKITQSASDLALTGKERTLLNNTLVVAKHRIIFLVGAYAGLRVSEKIQCRFSWLSWEIFDGVKTLAITIPDEARDTRNKKKIWKIKNTSILYIDPKTLDEVKKSKQRTTYILESDIANEVYFWFQNNPDGLQMSRQNASTEIVSKKFSAIIGRKMIDHALRSTAVNYYIDDKHLAITFVSTIMGHDDVRTTMDIYKTKSRASAESYLSSGVLNVGVRQ